MRKIMIVCMLLVAAVLAGCANKYAPPLAPGASEAEVIARHGPPTARYSYDGYEQLEYASGYWGQYAFFATLDSSGRLIRWEQVLTDEKFAAFTPGKTTKDDLLRTIGHPAEVTRIHAFNYEVWSYRYKKALSWDYMMHFMFDPDDPKGVLQKMESGIDPMFDPGPE